MPTSDPPSLSYISSFQSGSLRLASIRFRYLLGNRPQPLWVPLEEFSLVPPIVIRTDEEVNFPRLLKKDPRSHPILVTVLHFVLFSPFYHF